MGGRACPAIFYWAAGAPASFFSGKLITDASEREIPSLAVQGTGRIVGCICFVDPQSVLQKVTKTLFRAINSDGVTTDYTDRSG